MGDFDRCISCQGTGSILSQVVCPRCNGSCDEGKPDPPEKLTVYLVCRGSQEEGADIRQIAKVFRKHEDAVAFIEGQPPERDRQNRDIFWYYDEGYDWWDNQATYEYFNIMEKVVE